jgi:hypothetical protein
MNSQRKCHLRAYWPIHNERRVRPSFAHFGGTHAHVCSNGDLASPATRQQRRFGSFHGCDYNQRLSTVAGLFSGHCYEVDVSCTKATPHLQIRLHANQSIRTRHRAERRC